jgi:hypothetical protein
MTKRSHNFGSIRGDVAVWPCVRSSDYAVLGSYATAYEWLCFTPASL